MSYDFRGWALDLCSRPYCCHYRGEHDDLDGHCTGPGRDPDGFMNLDLPRCPCPEFLPPGTSEK